MRWLTVLAALTLLSVPAQAEDKASGPSPLILGGSLRTGYWSSNRQLDDKIGYVPTTLSLKMAVDPGTGWYARAEGWVTHERPFSKEGRARADLREGFAGWRGDAVEVTFGRRVISWGRADRINPTDVITSRDYTALFAEEENQKQGSVVATLSYAIGDLTATALWLPEFRPNVYPIPQAHGLFVRQGTDQLKADQFALRLDRTGKGFDWALSYFRGVNRDPGARLTRISATGASVEAVYDRLQVWGADFATNIGGFGLRGEVAYAQPDGAHGDIFSPRPFVRSVVGLDRNIIETLNVNVQYVFQGVFSYKEPAYGAYSPLTRLAVETALLNNQRLRVQHGVAVRIGYTTLNDTLNLEMSALAFFTDGSFVLRPRATYAVNDHVKVTAGADIFQGGRDSYFGQLKKNTLFLTEIRYSF